MKNHIHKVHEGHKDHKCESCDKSFSQKCNLKTHIDKFHEGHNAYRGADNAENFNSEISEPVTENPSNINMIEDPNIKVEFDTRDNDFFHCNCQEEDKLISTYFCEECKEGFCRSCVKVHQRIKVSRIHNLLQINYYCKCQKEEKKSASKYCEECSEAICSHCIFAHERFTQNHILKSI